MSSGIIRVVHQALGVIRPVAGVVVQPGGHAGHAAPPKVPAGREHRPCARVAPRLDAAGGRDDRVKRGTVPGIARLARALRGLWPDRNPLRRGIDRAEAGILATVMVTFLAGAPLAAMTAGRAVYKMASREQHTQQAAWHRVPAVLLAAPGEETAYSQAVARARWTAPDGSMHTGDIAAPLTARAETTVMVWVNASGQLTGPPLQPSQVADRQMLAAVLAPFVLGLILLAAGGLAHRLLDRRRLAAWEAEWRASGPRWTRHR
jgi:hypothetical protein